MGLDRRGFLRSTGVATGAAAVSTTAAVAGAASAAADSEGGRQVLTGIEVLHRDGYRLVSGRAGRSDQQPDRHRARPAARDRPDGRVRPGRPGGGLRPRARLPRLGGGRRVRGRLRRPPHRGGRLRHLRQERRRRSRRTSGPPGSTPCCSTSRTSAPASTPTSGRCTTAWSRRRRPRSGSSCSTGPTRSAAWRRTDPVMHPEHASFVGRKAISQQHGMTVAELAGLFNAEFVPADAGPAGRAGRGRGCSGWRRDRVPRGDRPAVGDAVTEHAAGRDRGGLPRHLPVRGDQPVGGPRDHAPVRADRCAVPRPRLGRRAAGAGPAGRRSSARRTSRRAPPSTRATLCSGVQLHVTDRDDFDAIRTAIAMIVTAKQAGTGVRVAGEPGAVLDRPAVRVGAGPARHRRRG